MENRKSVDQRRVQVLAHVHERSAVLQTQGAVVSTWRTRSGRRLGPYYLLVYREQGRQRSVYLGADAQLAADVRSELMRLQTSRQQQRRYRRLHRLLRTELARARLVWKQELRKVGLRLHGSEIRGWRTARVLGVSAENDGTSQTQENFTDGTADP